MRCRLLSEQQFDVIYEYDVLEKGKVSSCFKIYSFSYDHKIAFLITRAVVYSSFHSFHVILPYNVVLVNNTFVLMLFFIDVPTLNKVLSEIKFYLNRRNKNTPKLTHNRGTPECVTFPPSYIKYE